VPGGPKSSTPRGGALNPLKSAGLRLGRITCEDMAALRAEKLQRTSPSYGFLKGAFRVFETRNVIPGCTASGHRAQQPRDGCLAYTRSPR
jgi:hypothetical protein